MGLGQRKSRTFHFTWPVHNFPTSVTLVLPSDSRTFPYRAKDIANFSQRYINQDWTSRVAQMVRNPPVMWETWVQSLGQEESLEKAWQPTPVFLSGESHGQRNLVGYSPWGCKELDTTEQLSMQANIVLK